MARAVHLHGRDLAILEALAVRRVETLDYLHQRFFPGLTRKRAINRLGDLRRAGYLQRDTVLLSGPGLGYENVYRLGPRARPALRLRSLAADELARRRSSLRVADRSIPHQIASNRVGDWLGAELIPEHQLPPIAREHARHRPDAAYEAAEPDRWGRRLVFIEVDLGHYSRQRVLGKIRAFVASPHARSILFVTPDRDRSHEVSGWIISAYGEAIMERVQPLTLDRIRKGGQLDPGTEPARSDTSLASGRDITPW